MRQVNGFKRMYYLLGHITYHPDIPRFVVNVTATDGSQCEDITIHAPSHDRFANLQSNVRDTERIVLEAYTIKEVYDIAAAELTERTKL